MQRIITNTGKVYDINWCGASTVDYALRFEIINGDYIDIFQTFMNSEETKKIIHYFDEHQTNYYNYTELKGVATSAKNTFVVALNPKVLEDINKENPDKEIQEGRNAIEILNVIFGNE